MKSINMKKVAAVAAGLALVAGSVAAAVSWSDLVNTQTHTMKVAGIVVGSTAQPSDTLAANTLAGELAKKAVYTAQETKDVNKEVCTPLTTGAALDDSKSYRVHKALGSTNFTSVETKHSKLSSLVDESKTQTLAGDSLSTTLKETLTFSSEPSFNTDNDVQALTSEVSTGDLTYAVNLTGDDLSVGTSFDNNSQNYISLPFLGKQYVLDKTDTDEIQLVTSSSPSTYNTGDSLSVVGKDGNTYKVVVADGFISGETSYITLELYDSTGALIDSQDFTDDSTVTFYKAGQDVLEDSIYVDTVIKKTEASSDVFKARIRTGSGRVVLKDGYCYPDYTENDSSKCDWKANVSFTGNNLTSYGIENTKEYKFADTDALHPGDAVYFPSNFAAVKFVGLELPKYDTANAVDVTTVEIGNTIENNTGASDRGLSFTDNEETTHYLPFYYYLGSYSLDASETDGINFEFDGVSHFLAFEGTSGNDLNYYLGDGTYNSSEDYSYTAGTYRSATANDLNLTGADDENYEYVLAFEKTTSNKYTAWLLLKGDQDFTLEDGSTLHFRGTQYNHNTELDANIGNIDVNAYVPKATKMENVVGTGLTSTIIDDDTQFFTAVFDVESNTTVDSNTRVYIDTETGKLTDEDNSDNSLSYAMLADASIDTNWNATGGHSLKLESSKLKEYITDAGMDSEIVDNTYARVTIPKEIAEGEFRVYSADGIGTSDENCTTELVSTTVDVNKVYSPLDGPTFSSPYVMDSEVTADNNYIVIGGYFVNSAFSDVAADANESKDVFGKPLAKEGDSVTAMLNGNLYIAGYTADDTKDAVDALVDLLDSETLE